MVHFTTNIGQNGPTFQVQVGLSDPHRAALINVGLPVPSAVGVEMIIDTGADKTTIDDSIVAHFNLNPTGTAWIMTLSTQGTAVPVPTFEIELTFSGPTSKTVSSLTVCSGDIVSMGHHVFLGRDVLAECRMMYSGPDDLVILMF
jgi:hypothetical protein